MKTDSGASRTIRAGSARYPARRVALFLASVLLFASCKSTPPDTSDTADTSGEGPATAYSSKEQRLEIYAQAIKASGYSLRIFDGSIIEFRRSGLYYYVSVEDRDPAFVQLVFPAFWEIETKDEQKRAAKAASYASARTKGAKVHLSNEDEMDVSVTLDLYLPDPNIFADHFPRMLLMIDTGASHFEEQMMMHDWR
jgi:hypothetical protein